MNRRFIPFAITLSVLILVGACIDTIPPDSDPPTTPGGPDERAFGLLGTYFDSSSGSVIYEQLDERLDRFWSREGSDPRSPPDYFSVVWEGSLITPESGSYTFSAFGDDGVRVFIDGENVLPSAAWTTWSRGQSRSDRVFSSVPLQLSGTHAIRVEFFQHDADAQIRLNWTRPNGVSEVIPSSAFRAAEESSAQLPDGVPRGPSTAPTPQPGPTPPPGGSSGTPDDDPVYVDPNYEPEPQENLPVPTGPTQTRSYTIDSTTDFANPERGWYVEGDSWGSKRNPDPVRGVASHMPTLNMRYVRLDAYRNSALPQGFLADLESEFASWRGSGTKAVLRFAYNRGEEPDASLDRIKQHIDQLSPLLEEYQDVIAVLQGGFVGHWGEQHSSSNGISTSRSARQEFIDYLLDSTPEDMMVQFRYPFVFIERDPQPLAYENRFSGTTQARMGHYNDCIGAGESMGGTFGGYDGPTRQEEFERIYAIGPLVTVGGETCDIAGIGAYSEGDYIIGQMERMGWDYLNSEFYTGILQHWESGGDLAEISTRLGYRLSLRGATLPSSVSAGDTVLVEFDMENSGFGKVYNPRPLELVLIGPETRRLRIYDDARWYLPLGGERREITRVLEVPADLQPGAYRMYLALPDASPRLYSDSRYAIRLANAGVWDSARGMNDLGATLTVT